MNVVLILVLYSIIFMHVNMLIFSLRSYKNHIGIPVMASIIVITIVARGLSASANANNLFNMPPKSTCTITCYSN